MILEFQHTDILSPQRRMEATAENTLIAEGKRENQRLRNQRERLDQDSVLKFMLQEFEHGKMVSSLLEQTGICACLDSCKSHPCP